MASEKKSFVLYSDLIFTVSQLPNDKAGELFKHILMYVNDENPITDDLIINISFEPIKQQLKRDLNKWSTTIDERSNSGVLGNLKRWHLDLYNDVKSGKKTLDESLIIAKGRIAIKPIAKIAVNDNVNVTVNVNDNVIKKNIEERKADFKKSFTPFLEKFNRTDLNDFFKYWTEHGINDKKMRFEKEKSFGIERRLETWIKNKEKFAVNDKKEKKQTGAEAFKNLVYGSVSNL